MAASQTAFIHTTSTKSVVAHMSYVDSPVLDGQPYAAIQITHVWNPPGAPAMYNNHPVGVWYDGARWAIYNEDFAPMPVGASFAVKLGSYVAVTSTKATRVGSEVVIDDPMTNGLPDAHLFLTHDWNPPGAPATYDTKRFALTYDSTLGKWAAIDVDGTAVADGVSFNVHRGL
jgi:hypothetical protein